MSRNTSTRSRIPDDADEGSGSSGARNAETYVHPFDREDPSRRPADLTVVRPVTQAERGEFWSELTEKPWAFDFFGAVRKIEALYPELPGFGASSKVSEDLVRFSQKPSMAFAPCTMSECRPATDRAPQRLFVNFMGMLGPNGPMPLHITEHTFIRELHHKDFTFSRFLDVFNHRMVSLFYRAWAASNMAASFDRTPPAALAGDVAYADRERVLSTDPDRYQTYVGSLVGLGMPSLRHRDAVPDIAKLYFAGRLAGGQKGPEGLRAILKTYFDVPVEIEEFVGRPMPLPDRYWSRLGGGPHVATDADAKAGATLGTACGGAIVLGRHVWDSQGGIRITLGPMPFSSFVKFVPGSPSERRLRAWIRLYLTDEFFWQAVVVLDRNEVPKAQLSGRRRPGEIGTRLGWTSWIRSVPETKDRPDLAVRSDLRVQR
jgi:type VI secretion system protein ImpH